MGRGGARKGAGRKPVEDKKVPLRIFVRKSVVEKLQELGGEDITPSKFVSEMLENNVDTALKRKKKERQIMKSSGCRIISRMDGKKVHDLDAKQVEDLIGDLAVLFMELKYAHKKEDDVERKRYYAQSLNALDYVMDMIDSRVFETRLNHFYDLDSTDI